MKTAKRITAILLCFVMLLGVCVTSASALQIGDTVEFVTEYDEGNVYKTFIYRGKAKEGINKVESEESYCTLCYEFTVEKAGYYITTWRDSDFAYPHFAETYQNGTAKNYANYLFGNYYEDEYGTHFESKIFYLDEGVSLLFVELFDSYTASIKIEYFADSITDVRFKDEKDKYLFEDYDYIYFTENTFEFYPDLSIEFSNSETIDGEWADCSFENELIKGENTVKMLLPGYEEEVTIYYYKTSDFIESVVPENVDKYLDAKEYYDGSFNHLNWYDGENITFNFKDGTSKTVKYQSEDETYVTLPCGREFFISAGYSDTGMCSSLGEDEAVFYIEIGDTLYYSKECNVEKASFKENSDRLKSRINMDFGWIDFDWYISRFLSTGNVRYLKDLTENIGRNVSYVFEEISAFIRYYL